MGIHAVLLKAIMGVGHVEEQFSFLIFINREMFIISHVVF